MKKLILVVSICAVMPSCVSTPPLSEVTGTEQSEILIKDVVQRIKCELSDAFDEKTEQPEFLWLAKWTAHTDLTLTINDNAGIAPSGSFTQYRENAVNRAAGPSTFPATAARGVVNQFLTVSGGANLNGQAIRTETVSFTVALDELKRWRRHQDAIEADPNFPPEQRVCNFQPSVGVTGNLGLREWVNSAFFPAEIGQLQAGIHTASTAKANAPSSPSPGKIGPASSGDRLTVGELKELTKKWSAYLSDLKDFSDQSKTIDTATADFQKAQDAVKASIKGAENYRFVLDPYLKEKYHKAIDAVKFYSREVPICVDYKATLDENIKGAQAAVKDVKTLIETAPDNLRAEKVDNWDVSKFEKLVKAMSELGVPFNDDPNKPNVVDAHELRVLKQKWKSGLTECVEVVQQATSLTTFLPKQVDPPIDSILHSLTFVVSYGAGITPSWTLLQWKGPGQNPNLVSASGVRTHGLVIAIGPPGGAAPIGEDPLRLINLQAIRSINQQQ